MDAALEIIGQSGPDALSMREVSRHAGISHQAPYHHFGDRAGILAAIAEEGFDLLAAEFRRVLADCVDPSGECLQAYVRMATTRPGHFRVMFRSDICGADTHPSTARAANDCYEELQNMMRRTLGEDLDAEELFSWSSLLWSVAHGLSVLLVDGPLLSKFPPGISVEEHISAIITLMRPMIDHRVVAAGSTT